jgi:hypothetical protein
LLLRTPSAALATLALCAFVLSPAARAQDPQTQTVCTVTVNSPDERDALRRWLPEDRYRFVELVEKGRPDWLASACRQDVRCDVLVVSGHFDGGTEFYSDRVGARESLPVSELERASCSAACNGLFAQLKEVYLFGCNTLNALAPDSTGAEVTRSLLRAGASAEEATRVAQAMDAAQVESNRDSMRRMFAGVPVIYGFPAMAPLGASAGPTLARYLQATAGSDVGSGHASAALLASFSSSAMASVTGIAAGDPRAAYRRDVCALADEGPSAARKLAIVHTLLRRGMPGARVFLDRIDGFLDAVDDATAASPAFAQERDAIAADLAARESYLAYVRTLDRPPVRARMIRLAARLGWLPGDGERRALAALVDDMMAGPVSAADVDLACTLGAGGALDRRTAAGKSTASVARDAIDACLGDAPARARALQALTSGDVADVEVAQVYLRHRPLADPDELRTLTAAVAAMHEPSAQVRALETLSHYALSDGESLQRLARLFPRAGSVALQRAIAGVLLRADFPAAARDELASLLRRYRIKSPDGNDVIDVLIRHLKA